MGCVTLNIYLNSKIDELEDEKNVVLQISEDLRKFIIEPVPTFEITTTKVTDIQTDKFDAMLKQMGRQIEELRQDKQLLE